MYLPCVIRMLITVSWFRFLFFFSYFSSNRLFITTFLRDFSTTFDTLQLSLEHCTRIVTSTINSVHVNVTNSYQVRFLRYTPLYLICDLGNRVLYLKNLNYLFNEYTFVNYNSKAFRKYILRWGLRSTCDPKVAPTNDGHLEYTDTLSCLPQEGHWGDQSLGDYDTLMVFLRFWKMFT